MGCGISNVAACTAPQVGAACRFSRSSAGEPAEAAGAPTITTAERPWQLRGGDSHHHRVVEARETSPGPAAVFLRGTRSAAVGVHAANRQQTRVLSPVQALHALSESIEDGPAVADGIPPLPSGGIVGAPDNCKGGVCTGPDSPQDLANRQDHSAVSSEGDWMPGPSASSTSRYDSQDAPSAIKQPLATTDLTTGITTWRIANPRGVAGTRLAATMEPMDNWFAPRKGLWIGSEDTSPSGDVTFMVNFDVSAPERAHFVLEYSVTDALKRAMLNGKLLDIGVSDGFKRLGGKMWIEAPAGQGLFGYGENVLMLTVSSRGKGPAAIYVCGRASVAIDLTTGLAPWRQPHDHGRFQRGSAPMTIPHGLWYSPRSGSWLGDSRNWPPEDTTFELSFDVEMPDLASFTLRYAVDHGLKSAHLNGKSLDVSGTGSYHQCGGDMVIRARQGEGLFVQGSNTLQVTVSNGGTRHNPMGLYATGRLEMLPLKAADVAAEKEDDPMTAELQERNNSLHVRNAQLVGQVSSLESDLKETHTRMMMLSWEASQDARTTPLAATDLTTGIAAWRLEKNHGDSTAGAAPTTRPASAWYGPQTGSWLGNAESWGAGDATFSLRFDVSAPELANFELQYAVDDVLVSATLNGKPLEIGVLHGYEKLDRKVVIKAPPGHGLFGYGWNTLAVTVQTSKLGPGGFYARGHAYVAFDLTTGVAAWRQPLSHGRFEAGIAPVTEPNGLWYKPRVGSWIGDSKGWPSRETVFELSFEVSVPALASFELPYSAASRLKYATLNGKALRVASAGSCQSFGGDMLIRAEKGCGLFVMGTNVLAVAVASCGEGADGPMGFYTTGRLLGAVAEAPDTPVCEDNVEAAEEQRKKPASAKLHAAGPDDFAAGDQQEVGSTLHTGSCRARTAANMQSSVSEQPHVTIIGTGEARDYQAAGTLPVLQGLVWITVFRQTWPFLWSKGQGLSLNVSNPMADNFSILDCLEGCRGSDGLFWLLYRDVGHGGQYVMWQQSSNPATTGGAVNDFQGLCWGPNPQEQATDAPTSFRGMSLSARACLMSGNGESDEPWYVVGAFQDHNGGIPALKQAQETMSSQAELLVAIQPDALPNLMSTIKARLEPSEEVGSASKPPPALASIDITTGVACWCLPCSCGDFLAGPAPTTAPANAWHKPGDGSWLGHNARWPGTSATFTLSFTVSAPEWANFSLGCWVIGELSSATLNGKNLSTAGTPAGNSATGPPLAINAPASKGLFVAGTNILAVTVGNGGSSSPMGFYAQGIAAVAIDLSTGIAPWRLPRSHGRFQAGPAPVAEPHSSWHKPGGAFWIGNSRAWASGDAIFTLRFDVAVPDLASFELPYAVERSLKAASLNGKALDFGKPMGPKTLGRSMVIRAPQGTGLFVAGENVLAVTVSHGEGDDSPLGFCATGSLDMAIKNQPPPQPEVIVLDGEARKYQAGGEQPALPGLAWIVAFRQVLPYLWSKDHSLSLNPRNPAAQNFSVLEWLEGCRCSDGSFRFMYRDEHRGQYVAWQQSSNPLEATGQVKGFRVLQWGPRARDQDDSSSFSGLSFDGEHSLMGCRGMEHRWFGVGAYRELDGGGLAALKEAQETPSMCVELLVAVEPAGVNSLLERISQGSENQMIVLDGEARRYQILAQPTPPGLVWAVAFRQTLPYMWKMGQKLSLNAGDPSNSNFSVLDWIGNCCCADGRFRFMYRDQHEGQYVVWQQSTNPVLSTKVEGFKDLAWGPRMKARDNRFRGLALSGGNNCLMHGNDQGYWWYSVGAYKRWDGDIPALQQGQELSSKCVELLVAVEPETLVRVVEKIRESLEPHDEMERLQAAVERDLKGRGTALRGVEMDLKKHRLNLKREIGFLKSKADFTNMEDAHSLLDEVATVVDAVNAELKRRRMGLMGLCLEVHTLAGERVLLLTETRAKACRDYLVARMVEREPSDGIDPCALVRSKGVVKSDRTTVVIRLSFPGEDSG